MNYKKLKIPEDSAWGRPYKWYEVIGKLKNVLYEYRDGAIYDFLDKIIFTPHYNIKNGVRNLINWIPVIWKDRNWDYRYIYSILERKLELTRNEQVKANRHTSIDDTNKYITICLNLLDRLGEDYYSCEYFDYIKQEMNFVPYKREFNEMEDELFEGEKEDEEYFTMETVVLENNLDKYFALRPAALKRFLKTEIVAKLNIKEDDKLVAIYFSDYNQDRARKLLFKILNEKISSWWD